MTPIISILVPTRKRTEMLYCLLESLRQTAASKDNYEVIVRFSTDDLSSHRGFLCHKKFKSVCDNLWIVTGHPKNGWNSLGEFGSELSDMAKTPWVWGLSDDTTIIGKGWDEQFFSIPQTGVVVFPEYDRLDLSTYRNVVGGPFPAVPRDSWKQFGHETVRNPPDRFLDNVLRLENGWKPVFLQGITVAHERHKAKRHDAGQL